MFAIRGSHGGARRALVGVALAACCVVFPASVGGAKKSDIAPIVGKWSSAGAEINVVRTGGPHAFKGTVISGSFADCPEPIGPGTVVWKQMSGTGFNYSGKIPWVKLPDCSPIGDGSATFTLTSINTGRITSTSPDDSKTETASMTRIGTWPGAFGGGNKPKTNCKKNGKPVLCPKQKDLVQVLKALAKREAKRFEVFKKASKKFAQQKTDEAEDARVNVAGGMGDLILIAQGKKKVTLPSLTLPSFKRDWKQLKLPTREKAEGLAAKIPGDAGKLFGLAKEADQTLRLNNKLLQTAGRLYKTDPTVQAELDSAADYGTTGVHYDQLSPEDKLKAAYKVEGFLGEQFSYTNSAADLGKAGVKFTYTLKGAKL